MSWTLILYLASGPTAYSGYQSEYKCERASVGIVVSHDCVKTYRKLPVGLQIVEFLAASK